MNTSEVLFDKYVQNLEGKKAIDEAKKEEEALKILGNMKADPFSFHWKFSLAIIYAFAAFAIFGSYILYTQITGLSEESSLVLQISVQISFQVLLGISVGIFIYIKHRLHIIKFLLVKQKIQIEELNKKLEQLNKE